MSALHNMQPYEGEVFIGSNEVDRNLFKVGDLVKFTCFITGSTLWRVATETCESFTSKAHKVTIFIVKSKKG